MMKFKKFLAAAMTGAMMFGMVATAVPVLSVYADESDTSAVTKKEVAIGITGDKIVKPGSDSKPYSVIVAYDDGSKLPAEEVDWTLEGQKKTGTKIEDGVLTVDPQEDAESVSVKATVGSLSASWKVLVGTGAVLDIDYGTMTGTISSNGGDSFMFLEVLKDENGTKPGTVYCYEIDEEGTVSVDLSFLKISKPVYVRVYGNVNSDPLDIYKIEAQPKKPSVKYVAGKASLYETFQLNKANLTADTAATLQWKTQYGGYWRSFEGVESLKGLEEELDVLSVAGTTILVRQISVNGVGVQTAPPTVEVKVKIAAAPKAPKVTLDYAKDTIKLAKKTEIRVPDWNLPVETKDGEDVTLTWEPFYYQVGDSKEALSPSPAKLAETLVTEYTTAYEKAKGSLTEDNKEEADDIINELVASEEEEEGDTESLAEGDSEDEEPTFAEKLLAKLKSNGYNFLIRTKADKKSASQPAFVNVKAAPVIAIRQKESGEKDEETQKPIMVDEKVIAVKKEEVVTTDEGKEIKIVYGDALEYEWKAKTEKMKEEELVLKPASSNKAVFSYSVDGGTKWNAIKKETSIGVSKMTKGFVLVRVDGVKEDAKKEIVGAWASEAINVPVAVKEITIKGPEKITAGSTPVKYEVTSIKDFCGKDLVVKDQKITWSSTADGTKVKFDPETAELTVTSEATAGTVVIKAVCGGTEATVEVTIEAAATE